MSRRRKNLLIEEFGKIMEPVFSILSAIARGRNTATPGEKNVGDYLKQYLVRHGLQFFYELSTPSPVFRAQYNIIVGLLLGLSE